MEEGMISDRERAHSYKILAECYYRPDAALLAALGDFGEADGERLSEVVRNAPDAEDLERHVVDYSKLFVGPFKLLAPPYGSVYLEDGKFMGDSTAEARDLYEQEGLGIALKEAPDHIAVELEFVYFLALKEAEAGENADRDLAASLRDKQALFLRTHLGAWVEGFADNVEMNAQTEFYKALARTTRRFVSEDVDRFSGVRANPEVKTET